MEETIAARWAEDPQRVFTHRYWNGVEWTDRVAVDGHEGTCPMNANPEEARRIAASLSPVPPPPGAVPAPPPPPSPGTTGFSFAGLDATGTVAGHQITSLGRRFGAYLLDTLLMFVTFGIGWLVWALITSQEGQTPAKKLLDMRVVDAESGAAVTWAHYVLVRGGIGLVGGVIAWATVIGLAVYLLPFFNDKNQHFYGLLSKTAVIDV